MSFPAIMHLEAESIYKQYAAADKPALIGTLGMDEFGSLYRMCKAGADMVAGTGVVGGISEYPVANANVVADLVAGDMATCDLYSDTAAIGDRVIRIDDTNTAAARPVNFYEGGVAHFYGGAVAQRQTRRIVSSTVGTTASLYITLDAPLTVAITDGAVDAMTSPYSNCVTPTTEATGYESFVAFPRLAAVTSGYYFWGLTRGPCFGHYVSTWPGSGSGDKDVYFHSSGGITSTETVGVATTSQQRAGYGIMCNTSNYGCVYFMLQLE